MLVVKVLNHLNQHEAIRHIIKSKLTDKDYSLFQEACHKSNIELVSECLQMATYLQLYEMKQSVIYDSLINAMIDAIAYKSKVKKQKKLCKVVEMLLAAYEASELDAFVKTRHDFSKVYLLYQLAVKPL